MHAVLFFSVFNQSGYALGLGKQRFCLLHQTRDRCLDSGGVGIEGLGQSLHLFRILFGKVVLFAQILFQIIQLDETIRFYPVADEFPLPFRMPSFS